MGPKLHTPSSYPRLKECLGAACLPWVTEEYDGTRRGAALHSLAESIISGASREEAVNSLPNEWRADAVELDTTPFELLQGAMVEAGLAWSPETGKCRLLGQRMTRESARAACNPGEVPMVVDVLASSGPGELTIVDWKYGRGEDLGSAQEHWQLLTYAAVALVAQGASTVRCLLAKWRGGKWAWDEASMDSLDAMAHLEQVRARLDEAERARRQYLQDGTLPTLKMGRWCDWCPSQRVCPARAATLVAVVHGDASLATGREVKALSPEESGALLVRLRTVRELVDRAIADLNALARQVPLVLPNGEEYTPADRPRLHHEQAVASLSRVYGAAFADKAVPMVRAGSLTKTVREAARELLLPARRELAAQGRIPREQASMRAIMEEVRGVLEAAGALEVPTQRLEEPSEEA